MLSTIPKIPHICPNLTCKLDLRIPDHIKFRNKPVDETEINKNIMSIKNKLPAGYDYVPIVVIKRKNNTS